MYNSWVNKRLIIGNLLWNNAADHVVLWNRFTQGDFCLSAYYILNLKDSPKEFV